MPKVLIVDDGRIERWKQWKQSIAWDAEYAEQVAKFVRKYPGIVVNQVHDSFEVDAIKLASNPEAIASLGKILNLLMNVDDKGKLCYDVKTIPLEIK